MNKRADIVISVAAGGFAGMRAVQFWKTHETAYLLTSLYGCILCYYAATRRPPEAIDQSRSCTAVMLLHMFMPFLVMESNDLNFKRFGWALGILGTAGAAWTLADLGRSFGLLPANRGLVVAGAYTWVRHPLYLCYIVALLGMIFTSGLSFCNVLLFIAYITVTAVRICYEEKLLSTDAEYVKYCRVTKYRLIPMLF